MEVEQDKDKTNGLLEKMKNGLHDKITMADLKAFLKEKGQSTVGKKSLLIEKVSDLL